MPTGCKWWTVRGRLYNGDELLYLLVADRMARDEDVPAWWARK
jgi:hypothetical protein